jgi:hypothetical protein
MQSHSAFRLGVVPVFLRSYRLKMLLMAGLGVLVSAFVAERAEAFSSAVPVVQSVSNPQMASVLASTRNASLAAAKLVGAGAAGSPLTMQDFDDIAVIDASVLETPLDANEQAEGRDAITTQYRQNPKGFLQGLEVERKLAQVLLHGSATEQMQARTIAWLGWLGAKQSSPLAARWVATVQRHNSPVASMAGLAVTNRQLDALFVSNDWVAQAANLHLSTEESRAAFTRELPTRFAAMTQAERLQLSLADRRWDALRGVIGFGLQAKAVEIVHQNMGGTVGTDRISFYPNGNFERSANVLAGSGVVQAAGAFSGGASSVTNRNGTTASSSGTYAGAGGSVTARSSRSSSGGAGAATGTYRITGYTLELDCANGQTQRLLAFHPFPGKPQIFIGQVSFNIE